MCLVGTLNGGNREMLMSDLLQREVWFCFTSRNENPLVKMSRWNSFLMLSKLSLYPLPIPDDGGSNCCRNIWNLLHFTLVCLWKTFVTLTWHFVSTAHVYWTMLSTSQITYRRRNVRSLMRKKLERMWNDAVVFWFKALCLRLSWGTEEKYERFRSGYSISGS